MLQEIVLFSTQDLNQIVLPLWSTPPARTNWRRILEVKWSLLYTSCYVCHRRYGTTCHNFRQPSSFYASRQAWHPLQQNHSMGQMQTELCTFIIIRTAILCTRECRSSTGHNPRGRTPSTSEVWKDTYRGSFSLLSFIDTFTPCVFLRYQSLPLP